MEKEKWEDIEIELAAIVGAVTHDGIIRKHTETILKARKYVESQREQAKQEAARLILEEVKKEGRWHWAAPLTHMVEWEKEIRNKYNLN